MGENHQDKTGNKQIATDNVRWVRNKKSKLWVPEPKKPFAERMGFAGKTPWDLIQLLLIPLVLAGVGYRFTATQTQISLQSSQKQHDTDLQIAADQQRETILKTCLDDIKDLLLNKDLRRSKSKDEVRVVARVEVLAALWQLDGVRKRLLMQFLSEAGLVTSSLSSNDAIIDLSRADLSRADLRDAFLPDANLSYADLSYADLRGADLRDAFLPDANLHDANLFYAFLFSAKVTQTQLNEAKSHKRN